jgi:hypothetical protein
MMPLAAGLKLRDELLSLVELAPEPVPPLGRAFRERLARVAAFSLRIAATRLRCAARSCAMAAGPSAWGLLPPDLGLRLTSSTSPPHYPLRGL